MFRSGIGVIEQTNQDQLVELSRQGYCLFRLGLWGDSKGKDHSELSATVGPIVALQLGARLLEGPLHVSDCDRLALDEFGNPWDD